MSGTIPVPETAADRAVNDAHGAGAYAQVVATLETTDPALAAQQTGSVATYGKSVGGSAGGVILALLLSKMVAHFGVACSATATINCLSPDDIQVMTYVLMTVGAAGFAALMHWIGKAPARAALAAAKGAV